MSAFAFDVSGCVHFQLDGCWYIARPFFKDTSTWTPSQLLPVVCYRAEVGQTINAAVLTTWRNSLVRDDVCHANFLKKLYISGVKPGQVTVGKDVAKLLRDWGMDKKISYRDPRLPSGPYCKDTENKILYPVYRVYEDSQLAFSQALWGAKVAGCDILFPVDTAGNGYRSHGIAVPARSYMVGMRGPKWPLTGIRVAVQDNFQISGNTTSVGSRAFLETSSKMRMNAEVVTRLQRAGALIVGKTQVGNFSMREGWDHPMYCVDYQAPFNPRGDGYQITGGSSGGAAAAMAAYQWLDLAICSDTLGGARIPAFQTGVFAFRPSSTLISSDGLIGSWGVFDTPAWLGRDLDLFPDVLRSLRDERIPSPENKPKPKHIYLARDFVPGDATTTQTQAMVVFLDELRRTTGCTSSYISIHDDWKESSPVKEKDLDKYLYYFTRHGWSYAAYFSFDQFRYVYRQKNLDDGAVSNGVVRAAWAVGQRVTAAQYQEVLDRRAIFRDWFNARYYSQDRDCMVALHYDTVKPRYRDLHPGPDDGLGERGLEQSAYLSAILGVPELALPIAELGYRSRISLKYENLPIVIGLMGERDKDMELLEWTINAIRASTLLGERALHLTVGKKIYDFED